MGLEEDLGQENVGIGHVGLGQKGLSQLGFSSLVFAHFMGHDRETSLEACVLGKSGNRPCKGFCCGRCTPSAGALPAGLMVVELRSWTEIPRFFVGITNFVVIGALILQDLNLEKTCGGVERVSLHQLIGPLGCEILSFGAHDTPQCLHPVIGCRVACVANISMFSRSGVEEV